MEKPWTVTPRISLPLGMDTSIPEKSSDDLTQTMKPPPLPLEGGRLLRSRQ